MGLSLETLPYSELVLLIPFCAKWEGMLLFVWPFFPLAEIALGHRIISKAVFREKILTFHSNAQGVKQICLQPGISGSEEIWRSNSAFGLNKSKLLEILCDLKVLE